MPYNSNEPKYIHLPLPQGNGSLERRKRSFFGINPPDRGGRTKFATELTSQISIIESQTQTKVIPSPGIKPHLVFRIAYAAGTPLESLVKNLSKLGLSIVSYEQNKAIVAFREETDLDAFKQAIQVYEQGPKINSQTGKPHKSTKWDIFQFIDPEQMQPWGKDDRLGSRLRDTLGNNLVNVELCKEYKVDVELWHPGDKEKCRDEIKELETLFKENRKNECILDQYIGDEICLLKVAVTGETLKQLLEVDVIAEVDLPAKPTFNIATLYNVTKKDLPTLLSPPSNGPSLCIVDSGVASSHPLLQNHILAEHAVLTNLSDPSDQHGHGTHVAGIAVYGNVRACLEDGRFSSDVRLFSARVLNDNNEFDDDKLIITQMKEAISHFANSPYNCRVFNLSLGSTMPALANGSKKQTHWAEALDIIARDLDVIIVVASGNNAAAFASNAPDAECVLQEYRALFKSDDAMLSDPATAAIPITVGSIAEFDNPATQIGTGKHDITLAVAKTNEPSPFTRRGPGINGAIKPDFVDYGGNLVFNGFGNTRRINREQGTSVISFHREHLKKLFSYEVGTSSAAPRLARKASLLLHHLKTQLDREPSANLVRAVLASAATIPNPSIELFNTEKEMVSNICGLGLVDEDYAYDSSDRRVTLIREDEIGLDRFVIYEIPIPDEYINATGKKRLHVSLAFDPPVRHRRLDYLGTEMRFDVIRGKSLDEIVRAYKHLEPDEEVSKIKASEQLKLAPIQTYRKKSTLQKGSIEFSRIGDYGNSYWLVVRSERKWASADMIQRFAVVVTLEAETDQLYERVSQRVKIRVRNRS